MTSNDFAAQLNQIIYMPVDIIYRVYGVHDSESYKQNESYDSVEWNEAQTSSGSGMESGPNQLGQWNGIRPKLPQAVACKTEGF